MNNTIISNQQEESQSFQRHSQKKFNHPIMKLLTQYNQKLNSQQQNYLQTLLTIKQSVIKLFQQQFQKEFDKFEKQFNKNKQQFSTQIKTIGYYLQNFIQKHALNPKQNNLYPLFNQIDNKINLNNQYLRQQFKFSFNYPQQKQHLKEKVQKTKTEILSKQLSAIKQYLRQNQNLNKYCSKQIKKIEQIDQQYNQLIKMNEKKVFTPEIQFMGSYQQCLLVLQMNPKIQKLSLSIKSQSGKLSIQQYREVFSKLSSSKNILTNFTLKLMDMQFQQLKCNQIKMFIKQLKCLKSLKIQNYFRQNKLGMFEDFNWLPLKKYTHIFSKVW